jgi:hypothetical protein
LVPVSSAFHGAFERLFEMWWAYEGDGGLEHDVQRGELRAVDERAEERRPRLGERLVDRVRVRDLDVDRRPVGVAGRVQAAPGERRRGEGKGDCRGRK